MCQSRQVSAAELALQFAVQHPYVSSTFVGISTVDEARHNIEAISKQPDEALLREIERIVAPVQGMMWITGYAANH